MLIIKVFKAILGSSEAQEDPLYAKDDMSADDLFSIAEMYANGDGLEKNYKKAAHYYQQAIEKGSSKAQGGLQRLYAKADMSADDLFFIGKMYANGDGVEKSYKNAAQCYQLAIEEKNYPGAQLELDALYVKADMRAYDLFSIGEMYAEGKGVKKNYKEAALRYQQAIEKGAYAPKVQEALKRLYAKADMWEYDLFFIGEMYAEGKGVKKSYKNAARCYQLAIEKGAQVQGALDWLYIQADMSVSDLIYIAGMYANSDGVKKNYKNAVRCYQKAIEKGAPGEGMLKRLYAKADMSAEDLIAIGKMYADGDGIEKNYKKAARHYQQAIEEKNYPEAQLELDGLYAKARTEDLIAIGKMYANGDGVKKNYKNAARCYKQAVEEKNYSEAQLELDSLYVKEDLNADDLIAIGGMYKFDNSSGLRWYIKAKEKSSALADVYIGLFHQHGMAGFKPDTLNAAMYYRQAIIKGGLSDRMRDEWLAKADASVKVYIQFPQEIPLLFSTLPRKALKKIVREQVITRFRANPDNYLEITDGENETLLHKTAKAKLFKDCARLLFLGASADSYNAEGKKPLECLGPVPKENETPREKVTRLKNNLSSLIAGLRMSTPEVLAPRIIIEGAENDPRQNRRILRQLYQKNEIKPLMDLAKLAVLGLHNKSGREKYFKADYDSDDDDNESLKDQQKLSMRFDARSDHVGNMRYYGEDGRKGVVAMGLYPFGKNTLYFGGKRPENNIKGTFYHELTHFVADEVFDNQGKPYSADDNVHQGLFNGIAQELERKKDSLNPILQEIFELYGPENYHAELIARVPEILIRYPDGRAQLFAQAPRLLGYYENFFLTSVREHTSKLEQRALSDWPMELFTQNSKEKYAFSNR